MFKSTVFVGSGALKGVGPAIRCMPAYWVELVEESADSTTPWHFLVSPVQPVREGDLKFRDPRASWFVSGGGAVCGITEVDGVWTVFANTLMVYIHRTIAGLLDSETGNVGLRITITNAASRSCEFTTSMSLGLHHPTNLRYEFVSQAVNDFCTPHVPTTVFQEDHGEPGDVITFSDEVAGDVATEDGASVVTAPDHLVSTASLKLTKDYNAKSSYLHDATLVRAESGVSKMRWIADYVRRIANPGSAILVGGDHPGTLSRRLSEYGYDVTGLDPLNEPALIPRSSILGTGGYRQLKERVSVGTLIDDYGGTDWGGCVFDVAVDRNSAEPDTAVNLGAATAMAKHGVAVCVGKARSVPRVPGNYFMLDNWGWEVRGCEAYFQACKFDDPFPEGARCLVHVPPDLEEVWVYWADPLGRHVRKAPPWMSWFFTEELDEFDRPMWRVSHELWYHFVTFRVSDHAALRRGMPLCKEILDASSGVDVWLALKHHLGPVDPLVRSEVANRFRTDDPIGARGVPKGLLAHSPGLLECMAGRYERLLSVCQDPGVACPWQLALIMKHPGAGALLSDLSQIRSLLGENQVSIAEFSRVLPWGSMSILGSEMFFRMIYFLALMTARVYKPLHAWELQHKLWALSSFGTDEERYLYFLDQFERIFSGVDQARSAGRRQYLVERCLQRFDENLQILGVRGAFLQFDRPYSLLLAERNQPRTSRRAVRTTRGRGSESGTTYEPSVMSMAAGGGGGPIRDLAEFGRSLYWGPATTLHEVLSATKGRADPGRAYSYWCGLSPVMRPPGVARRDWYPRIQLNTDIALSYRLPGLTSPQSFLTVRDQQLEEIRARHA